MMPNRYAAVVMTIVTSPCIAMVSPSDSFVGMSCPPARIEALGLRERQFGFQVEQLASCRPLPSATSASLPVYRGARVKHRDIQLKRALVRLAVVLAKPLLLLLKIPPALNAIQRL